MNFAELNDIYTDSQAITDLDQKITEKIQVFQQKKVKTRKNKWDEKDIFLITYGDQFFEENEKKLRSFKKFYDDYLQAMFTIVHFLPFYPYTSDDGFSVVDYEQVNPEIGDWQDVAEMGKSSRLMFDFVCNHMSAASGWFQGYLKNQPEYQDFFINMNPAVDLSSVTRPRTSPLLTPFKDSTGVIRNIWTTFSADQVDLNVQNPQVLLRLIDVLLFYLEQGGEFIRLDAVGFMWKEVGTTSIHLPQTHKIIQLFRSIVKQAAPGTVLITETNVPHQDNISYFGNGYNEAQMVYQFPLPPLVLTAIKTGDSQYLKEWSKTIQVPTTETTFFNFLASHDGIGLNPVRGIVPEAEINQLVNQLQKEGALVSYKENSDGTKSPYEINVTYMDALSQKDDSDEVRLKRMLLAHSILVTLPGVPAVYIQSILGSRNDYQGVVESKQNRRINRKKYALDELQKELADSTSLRHQTYRRLKGLLAARKKQQAFHPNASLEVLASPSAIYAYQRKHANEVVYLIHNVSQEVVYYQAIAGSYENLLALEEQQITSKPIKLQPYEFLWLKIKK